MKWLPRRSPGAMMLMSDQEREDVAATMVQVQELMEIDDEEINLEQLLKGLEDV